MCGIAGFVDPARDLATLKAMTDAVRRRGPDDSGYFLEDGVGLGHRRLAIIDLTAGGHQPMESDGLVITFNGEIYNYREVRAELEQCGDRFHSSSDTEVILKAFRRWGPRCVDRFIGMFAMGVFDRSDKSLYLIRDRAGVKPLYYYCKDGRLAFGSELKCLRPYLSTAEQSRLSDDALSEFFAHGYISEGRSILENVQKVPQGQYLEFRDGRVEAHRYWNAEFEPDEVWGSRSENDLLDELEDIVISAFNYRMVADVPVGVFLSSGIDSSLVAAVLSRHHGQIHTFTIGFAERDYDESVGARRIAEHLGTVHTEAVLGAEKGFEILKRFPEIYDEPYADTSGVPTTYVSEIAKAAGMKVVLSGDGGDELFGGYTRYTEFLHRWRQSRRWGSVGRRTARAGLRLGARLRPDPVRGRLSRYADLLRHDSFAPFYQNMFFVSSQGELGEMFPGYREPGAALSEGDPLAIMSKWDFDHYLPDDVLVKVDRATMFHSIESREPFLDQRLVGFGARLPSRFKVRDGDTKYLLKRLLGRYLPESLYRLPKRGFAVPAREWIRDFYHQEFIETVEAVSDSIFDRRAVQRLIDSYRAGKPINYSLLWQLFSFQTWHAHWRDPGSL